MKGKAASSDQLNNREMEILARLSTGLSDQQIAEELFLSLNTVKWYNRQIYSKLGVSSRTQAIAGAKRLGLLDSGDSRSHPRYNLPAQSAPFIGRGREIAEVKELLSRSRLLTLTGTGGIGKTRLALRVAAEVASTFSRGVCCVDLAPLSDHTLVIKTIAAALGTVENTAEPLLDTIKRVLARQELLLLIDNYEHVISAAPLLSALLAAAQHLKILVTSREPLRLGGEQEYPVPPLSLPLAEVLSVQELIDSEAGSLFVYRAQMTRPHFEVSAGDAPAIAQICLRLDGLPLAIELAAARTKLLTPQALLERLAGIGHDSSLRLLTGGPRDAPPRHRTLRETIAWSYNLLAEHEKLLFARLAVFRGGCSLDAVETVCSAGLSTDLFDGLSSLVDKSLVQQKETADGEPRFIMLEMIREYALGQLQASGEAERMQRRHALYFVDLSERAEPEMRLRRYDHWCQRFEVELDNLRAVLEWTLCNGDVTLGVRLAGALCLFWYGKGHHVDGIRWTQQLLERLGEVPVVYHAAFLVSAGHMAWMHDLDAAQHLFKRALDLARDLGDKVNSAWALAFLGYTMMQEAEAALATAEQALCHFRKLNHQPGIAQTLNIIGEVARVNGDDSRARIVYEECLAVCRQTGEARRICYMLNNLTYIAQHEGDHERALALVRQSLQLARDRKDRYDTAWAVGLIAGSIGALGELRRAVQLLSASEAALEHMGSSHQPSDKPEHERIVATMRAQLGDTTFALAWTEGQEMTLEQAVAYALDE